LKLILPDKEAPFTKEQCAKGGKAETVFKSLSKSLAKREKCSVRCHFFDICPVSAMSMGYEDPRKPEEKGKCLMREFPPNVRQQFVNLFLTGEEGIIKAIKDALHMYMMEVDVRGTLRDKRDMVDLMLRFYKEIYVNPRGVKSATLRKEPLTITIRRVGIEPQRIQIDPSKVLPEGVTMRDVTSIANGDITEADPESLFTSPNLGRIVGEEIKIESNFDDILGDDDE